MRIINRFSILTLAIAIVFTFGLVGLTKAATSVNLGSADGFSVLAGSAITNTGSSVISGDLGLSPGTAVTGFPPATLNGTQHVANANAVSAQAGLTAAYNAASGQTPVTTVPAELGGTIKLAGVYSSVDGSFGITGTLTLDAQGDANAVFIFKTASTLITAGASNVVLLNGAQACNVFWQVGSSATLGTNSTFKGNILALTSATLTTGASVEGRILARNGAVTLDTNTISKATCTVAPVVPVVPVVLVVPPAPVVTSTPEPVIISAPVVTSTPASVITPEPVAEVLSETVITPVPNLPETGIAPDNNIAWSVLVLAGMFVASVLFYVARRKSSNL